MLEDVQSTSFTKKIELVDADTGIDEGEEFVKVYNHFNGSYSFIIVLELQPEKSIEFITSWEAQAPEEGNYTITISAFAIQADRIGERHTLDQACFVSKNVAVLKGVPKIENVCISPVYELGHIKTFSPNQDVVVRCNVISYPDVKNVTLFLISHPIDSSPPQAWNRLAMTESQENEWIGIIPKQPDAQNVTLYIEAFSSVNVSSRRSVGSYEVVDLVKLEFKTKNTALAIIMLLIAGSIGILILERRKISEEL